MDMENYFQRKKEYAKQYMPQYHKDRAALFLSQHRCTKCGAKDEYTLSGRHQCKSCCDKAKAYRRGERQERPIARTLQETQEHLRENHREYMRERRAMFRAHQCCTQCGSKDALTMNGLYLCQDCWEKKHNRPFVPKVVRDLENEDKIIEPKMTQFERNERARNGFCYICGAPTKEGEIKWGGTPHKLCERHYDLLVKAGEPSREKFVEKQHKITNNFLESKRTCKQRKLVKQ